MNNKKISEIVCTCCPIGCTLNIDYNKDNDPIITGNRCIRGKKYAQQELIEPKRTVTTIVKVINGTHNVISVKTDNQIPKNKIFLITKLLSDIIVKAPIKIGDIIVKNIAETNVNIIATKNINCKKNII